MVETDYRQSKGSILSDFVDATPNASELYKANAIQQECARVGFDWPSVKPVYEKIIEELDEVKEALANPLKNKTDVEEELGDLLFACVNLCRHLHVSPDAAISVANKKFVSRFQQIESILHAQGKNTEDQSLESLEALWLQVKNPT